MSALGGQTRDVDIFSLNVSLFSSMSLWSSHFPFPFLQCSAIFSSQRIIPAIVQKITKATTTFHQLYGSYVDWLVDTELSWVVWELWLLWLLADAVCVCGPGLLLWCDTVCTWPDVGPCVDGGLIDDLCSSSVFIGPSVLWVGLVCCAGKGVVELLCVDVVVTGLLPWCVTVVVDVSRALAWVVVRFKGCEEAVVVCCTRRSMVDVVVAFS